MTDQPNETTLTGAKPQDGALVSRSEPAGLYAYPAYAPEEMAEPYSPGLAAFFHALRRRWWLAVPIGLLCAALAAPVVWITHVPQYTATAVLRIAAVPERILFNTAETAGQNFALYKNTQSQLLTSDFVLISALRRTEVAQLAVLRDEEDPVRWLSRELRVSFPADAEIMRVQISGEDPAALAALVNAVIASYMEEVVHVERDQRRARLDELDRVYTDKEVEMRRKMTDLRQLAEQLGTGDTSALAIRQQYALQQFGEYRRELMRVQFELRRLVNLLRIKQSQFEQADNVEVSALELDAFAETDPTTAQLLMRQNLLERMLAHLEETVRPHLLVNYSESYETELEMVEERLKTRREQLREQLEHRKHKALAAEVGSLQTEIAIKEEEQRQLAQDVESMGKQVQQVGGSSVDVDILSKEIASLEGVLNPIAEERERLRVELRAGERITILQHAEPPRSPNQARRVQQAGLAGMAGFVLPAFALVFWDVRKKRVNTADDVARGLGMSVLGTVPTVPLRAVQHGRKLSRKHQHWRTMLNEAIDNVIVHLLRQSREEPMQVLLVTSAGSGEGKTTLATHMAMSLARSGRRTLLVDCDLRRPALHRMFQVDQEPGVAELLLSEARLDEVLHETSVEGLDLVSAGGWLDEALEVLSSGAVETWFEKLRADYDFIVVDGSPVLPVSDARLIAQHADAVVLSVLRDVSQSPKVQAAARILTSLGVKALSSVVTGTAEEVYYKDYGYVGARETVVAS